MHFIQYIKDCIDFAKHYPCHINQGGKPLIWIRNVLYLNAQPKYWHGRLIGGLIRFTDRLRSLCR